MFAVQTIFQSIGLELAALKYELFCEKACKTIEPFICFFDHLPVVRKAAGVPINRRSCAYSCRVMKCVVSEALTGRQATAFSVRREGARYNQHVRTEGPCG